MTGYDYDVIIASAIQDCAAVKVAEELDLEEETCLLHDRNKIRKSCVRTLVRTKDGVAINPFHEGQVSFKKVNGLKLLFFRLF